MRRHGKAPDAGFTLMEMLVTLVIFGVVSSLLWQALGTLGKIETRLADSRLFVSREALYAQWLRQSLQGLMNGPTRDPFRFTGEARRLHGYTTMPPWPGSSGPERFELLLENGDDGRTHLLARRWGAAATTVLWSWEGPAAFSYLDDNGAWLPDWPPARRRPPPLPRAVRLDAPEGRVVVVAPQVDINPMLRRRDVEDASL